MSNTLNTPATGDGSIDATIFKREGTAPDLVLPEETPVEETPDAPPEELAATLEDQLKLHDAASQEAASETPATAEDEQLDWSSERMVKLDANFKEVTGVGIKEAYDLFAEMKQELATLRGAQQDTVLQQAANQLKEGWAVNDAEFTRRTQEVAKYVSTLGPDLQKSLDNVNGVQLVWNHLQSQRSQKATGGGGSPQLGGSPQTFSRRQVENWMVNDPDTYNKHQVAIAAARKAGTLTD